MAPYKKPTISSTSQKFPEITNVQAITPSCSAATQHREQKYTSQQQNTIQVYTAVEATQDIGQQVARTASVSVTKAAAEDFINPVTARRAKKADWARVLPPYNVGPEEQPAEEPVNHYQGEIQKEETQHSKQGFSERVRNVAGIMKYGSKWNKAPKSSNKIIFRN